MRCLHRTLAVAVLSYLICACGAITPAATPGSSSGSSAPLRPTPAAAASPAPAASPAGTIDSGKGNSNVELAHQQLQQQATLKTTLVIVSSTSSGVEGAIYRDLLARNFRSSTGPDEGIDTRELTCYPNCVFVPANEVNSLSVEEWVQVLRHEYRHNVQAAHNPNMAADFRGPDGRFTSYGAFSEACADYGLNVAPVYQAQVRIDQLRTVLGATQQSLIDQACQGDKPSYDKIVQLYNAAQSGGATFSDLFPTYQ